jgi:NADPH-dependent curcumin reductase CurA
MSTPKEGKAYILESPPVGAIKPDTFKLVKRSIQETSDLKQGDVIIKILALSNEPAQRIWMDGQIDPVSTMTDDTPLSLS